MSLKKYNNSVSKILKEKETLIQNLKLNQIDIKELFEFSNPFINFSTHYKLFIENFFELFQISPDIEFFDSNWSGEESCLEKFNHNFDKDNCVYIGLHTEQQSCPFNLIIDVIKKQLGKYIIYYDCYTDVGEFETHCVFLTLNADKIKEDLNS